MRPLAHICWRHAAVLVALWQSLVLAATTDPAGPVNNGEVSAFGFNRNGQAGDGTIVNRNVPQLVAGISNVMAAESNLLVLKGDGTVWEWGDNAFGQIGDGMTTNRPTPMQVPNLSGVTAVAVG